MNRCVRAKHKQIIVQWCSAPHRQDFLNKTALTERLRNRFSRGKRDRIPLMSVQSAPVEDIRAGLVTVADNEKDFRTDSESPHSVHVVTGKVSLRSKRSRMPHSAEWG